MTSVPSEPSPGSWPSPLSAALVSAASASPSWPPPVGDEVWWCVTVPGAEDADAGIRLLAAGPGGQPREILPPGHGPRSRIVEYGGRPWTVDGAAADRTVVWGDARDQRLWGMTDGAPDTARPLTPTGPGFACYADPVVVGSEVWCVRERRRAIADRDVHRDVVAVPLDGAAAAIDDAVRVVVTAQHFLTALRPSPEGTRLAWIGWNHPAMPWDGTELMVADLRDGVAHDARRVLGGTDVSVCQVEWADEQTLYALADPDGWWNLHRVPLDGAPAQNVLPLGEECGGAGWRIGSTWCGVLSDGRVALSHGVGRTALGLWDPADGSFTDLAPEWTEWGGALAVSGTRICDVAGAVDRKPTVVTVDVGGSPPAVHAVAADSVEGVDAYTAWIPPQQPVVLRDVAGRALHAVVLPPTHPRHHVEGRAPYLVHVHGGPTGRTAQIRDLELAFFTSRGIGVVCVDYGGSTGYGRDYRERLRGKWGEVDVQDTVSVARWLVETGRADPERIAVRGGSAGGWTSLAVAGRSDAFCASTVYYPISDPATWAEQTHDFESRYLDSMIGPWPAAAQRYRERSPRSHAAGIVRPLLMLQGLDDVICPPAQAQVVIDVLRRSGTPHRYLTFAGERHGFRRASTVAACLTAELDLYGEAMGFAPDAAASEETR